MASALTLCSEPPVDSLPDSLSTSGSSVRADSSTLWPLMGMSAADRTLRPRLWPRTSWFTREPRAEKVRGPSCDVSVLYETDECDEKDKADVGGERGGRGIVAGSTFGPVLGLV